MPFSAELNADLLPGLDRDTGLPLYRLTVPLGYTSPKGVKVCVPVGYETDLASIPRALHTFFSPAEPKARRAAVLHDYLYSSRGFIASAPDWEYSRADADNLFRDALRECGVGRLRRNLYFAAVRLFGRTAWEDND